MSLKVCDGFQRIFPNRGWKFMTFAWSMNLLRGLKSFDDIPKATAFPYLEMMLNFNSGGLNDFHKFVDDIHKGYGPIFIGNLFGKDLVFISDADANVQMFLSEGKYPKRGATVKSWKYYMEEPDQRRGLFFMDFPNWLKARSVFNKIMLKHNSMENHVKSVNEVCHNLVELWKTNPPKNLKYQIYDWNVECIGKILFGKNLGFAETLELENSLEYIKRREFVDALFKVYVESTKLIDVPRLNEIKEKKPIQWTKFCEAMKKMLECSEYYVQEAIKSSNEVAPSNSVKESIVYKALIEEHLDEETIKGVVADLFLGSSDTISHTALWALYLLGKNPEVANEARKEVFSLLKRENELTLSTIEIPYICGIIKETMRLYPAEPFVARKIAINAELCGYLVKSGSMVVASSFSMGRDPVNFSNPLQFQPERWFLNQMPVQHCNIKILNQMAYTPFAMGARSCIGKNIAELDLSLLLIKILTTFEWTVNESVEPIMKLKIVPSKGFNLNLRRFEK